MKNENQICLIVLDGWGHRIETNHNAVATAKTPNFDKYWKAYPHTLLEASGLAVGLPVDQMGNSEVGHMTIGAGRPIYTDLVRIKKAIEADEFISNPAFVKIFDHVKIHNSTLHINGLLGHGGVHAHSDHLIAFLKVAKKVGIEKIAIHVFTDGRDTAPQSSVGYLEELETTLEEIGIGFIATASGRFYAMDRDNNWDRLAKTEDAIYRSVGNKYQITKTIPPSQYIKTLHDQGVMDEHLPPIVFLDENGKTYPIEKDDGVFFFNFRSDRAIMLAKNISEKVKENNWCFVTLTEYHKDLECLVAFPSIAIETTLAKEISETGLTQSHIAETEKFPHATYFLNGGVKTLYAGEKHIMLDSRKDVATHDLAPKMRAESIADKAIEEINLGVNFIFINFANPDMVGHTANVPAIIEALEETDLQFGRVVEAMLAQATPSISKENSIPIETEGAGNPGEKIIAGAKKVAIFVTADHGNAEVNIDAITGDKHTAHTINPVPAIFISSDCIKLNKDERITLANRGTLADITPTILEFLEIEKPSSMLGSSLLA